jgi:hypothetical protein
MKIKQISFNHQQMVALLLAGLILAAGLAWVGTDASSSTFPLAKIGQTGAHSLQTIDTGPSTAGVDCSEADFMGRESGLALWSQLRSVKGSKLGSGTDGASLKGCESGLAPWSQLRSTKGSKPGVGVGSGGSGNGGSGSGGNN